MHDLITGLPPWAWSLFILGLMVVVGMILALPGVPGQGLLTILIGLMLLDLPGKRRLERKIVGRPRILRTINRLRKRFRSPQSCWAVGGEKFSAKRLSRSVTGTSGAAGRTRRARLLPPIRAADRIGMVWVQPARRSRSIRSSIGGWVMNSRINPRRVAPEMPKAASWSGKGCRP